MWSVPADGAYRVRVRDLRYGSAGGKELTYRLTIEPANADFSLTLTSDIVNVVQGAKSEIEVRLRRKGGFTEPVRLSVENIPAGVTVDPLELAAGQDTGKLSFTAAADARPADCAVRIIGMAEHAGSTISHVAAAAHLAHDAESIAVGPLTIDQVQLTVCHKPVFKLYCNEAYQYAHRGTIYRYLMEVERLDGFDGPIELELADRQIKDLDGVEILNTTIVPGTSSVMLPIYLPETMHINVQAHSNVYSQGYAVFTDQWGQRQSLLVVSTMRCMIRPLPTVARLKSQNEELVAAPGSTMTCRLQLDRTSNFSGPVTIELVSPKADQGISAEPMTLAASETTIDIPVHVARDPAAPPNAELLFRAIGQLPDNVQLITETHVPFRSAPATENH
jgi:hypothetical protein